MGGRKGMKIYTFGTSSCGIILSQIMMSVHVISCVEQIAAWLGIDNVRCLWLLL
jgi:hypothetical protein